MGVGGSWQNPGGMEVGNGGKKKLSKNEEVVANK